MELGGNITLEGFDNLDPAKLIVIKKIAGSFAKKVNDEQGEYEKLTFTLDGEYKISITLKQKNKELSAENEDNNLFFTLSNAIKILEAKF